MESARQAADEILERCPEVGEALLARWYRGRSELLKA
jgi:hypothetical protein